ncbi:MAG TPA: radical SAM protein [Polyangiaceae bacterium]|nr:radical SAM protein [Polyangiaceae bacterium]
MWTEETHSAGVAARDKTRTHEEAAHDRRNWVRLTFDCNDHCIFCLDADAHDGTIRSNEDVKRQILDGRRVGATRLILSGGEPTIHPKYVDFIRLGALAGYPKIQTVTNGRMFAYDDFLRSCLDAGLSEITFSLHGPNARVHDALVGTKGAFDEEMRGLKNALAHREASGRPIVNVDVVVNRANVKHLAEMLSMLLALGVGEFDLLQVVPFGRAFRDGRDTLFYDLEEARPHIQAALEYSKRPDVHLWMNRFPPQHLEGFEHLIQDPYKLNDEVRGRKEEFARWIDTGEPLDCRDPARCRYCYLEKLCDSLVQSMDRVASGAFEIVRVDTEAEAHAPSSFGGDPATARKRLPLAGNGAPTARRPLSEILASSGARKLHVVAPNVARAMEAASRFPSLTDLELRLDDWSGMDAIDRRVVRVEARTAEAARAFLAAAGSFEVVVDLTKDTAPWLLSLDEAPARLALRQPTYERASDAREHDVDLRVFFASFRHAAVPVEGVPACILGREPRRRPPTMDLAAADPGGRLEIFRWTRRYVEERYMTRSLRCSSCAHASRCEGVHVNFVRAHGFAQLQPVTDPPPPPPR